MLRLRGKQRSSIGRMFTPRRSNGSDEDSSDAANTAEGLASFEASPLRNASERVASLGTVLNQAHDWIATNRHHNDEPVDQEDDGYFTDGEDEDGDPVPHDEVELLMLEACEQISQHTESGKISPVSEDSGPSKAKFITSKNVTERRRPPLRSKRLKKEDNDGKEDLHKPLPRREHRKRRTKAWISDLDIPDRVRADFTCFNDVKQDAKETAHGRGSARSLRRSHNSHENSRPTETRPPPN